MSDVKPVRAAVFATVERADAAVRGLLDAGFSKEEITVLCSDETRERHFRQFEHQEPAGSHTVEGAATGGAIGAALGGLTALAGLVTMGGAPIAIAGAAAAAGGWTVIGGLVGALTTRGLEKEVADFYDQAVTAGQILVAVEEHGDDAPAKLNRAEQIFRESGAEPVELSEG